MGPEGAVINQALEYGVLGLAVIALALVIRVLWGELKKLQKEKDELQQARLNDRDVVVKAVIQSTDATTEMMRYLESRRR